jgi:5,10-methylenetetrahydromethanopterin reductase
VIETTAGPRRLGVMFDRSLPPEALPGFAREVERLGADDLWVVEDLRWAGSIASAGTALAVTETLRVGIGIAPAPLRNPALLAMELGTLARLYPGRLVAGVGHGALDWMREVGAAVPNQLALLEETISAVRAILRGEEVTLAGRAIHLDGMRLVHPPQQVPPVIAGVIGPRSLTLSGRVADGTLIVEGRGPNELAGIRALIDKGRANAAAGPHELLIFTHLCLDEDAERVNAALAPIRAEYSGFLGVPPEEVFTVSGGAADVAGRARDLWQAGVDTVILRPVGDDPLEHFARAVAAIRA